MHNFFLFVFYIYIYFFKCLYAIVNVNMSILDTKRTGGCLNTEISELVCWEWCGWVQSPVNSMLILVSCQPYTHTHTHYPQHRKGQFLCQNVSFHLSPVRDGDKLTAALWKAGQHCLLRYLLRRWPRGGLCITGPNCCGLKASLKESARDPTSGLTSAFVSLSICDLYVS